MHAVTNHLIRCSEVTKHNSIPVDNVRKSVPLFNFSRQVITVTPPLLQQGLSLAYERASALRKRRLSFVLRRHKYFPSVRGGTGGFGTAPAARRRDPDNDGGGRHRWGTGQRLGD